MPIYRRDGDKVNHITHAGCPADWNVTHMADVSFPKSIQLLNAATAANGIPSLVSDGFELNDMHPYDEARILVESTAGSGAMDVTCRFWLWSPITANWHPTGVGIDGTKGTLDAGTAMGETDTDTIQHMEIVTGLKASTRAYLEIVSINGTATAISAYLVAPH